MGTKDSAQYALFLTLSSPNEFPHPIPDHEIEFGVSVFFPVVHRSGGVQGVWGDTVGTGDRV